MKKEILKCHLCGKEYKYVSIGKHYKCIHKFSLKDDGNYIIFFEYNYPNFIDKIINECNDEKKSVNVLLKEKYLTIGEGTINRLQSLLKNRINVTREDIQKLRTDKRRNTCIRKYGKIYSDKFLEKIGGFKTNNRLAKRASILGKEAVYRKYGSLIVKNNYTSKWHIKLRQKLYDNQIITEHEKKIVKQYTTDEFDINRNVCIEFNGDFWHCNPNIYHKNYMHPLMKMTAKEIWKRDNKKYKEYKKAGYDVFIIWESDNIDDKIKEYKEKYGY